MITFPLHATDQDILQLVRAWIELLAEERYEDAYQILYHSPNDHWRPDLLRTVVANYGDVTPRKDGATFRVTSLQTGFIQGQSNPYQDVEWFDSERAHNQSTVGWVHFDVPLNGEWSDVTARFLIVRLDDRPALALQDMHVL